MPDNPDNQELENLPAENQDDQENNESQDELNSNELASPVRAQRSQLRAAITSIYHARPYSESLSSAFVSTKPAPEETKPALSEEADELKKKTEIDTLMQKAEVLARNGEQERARQIFSQAVRLAPENSDAWAGLGRLLVEQNPERARYCLKRALALDPENKLAQLTLKTVEEQLHPEPEPSQTTALARIEEPALPVHTEATGLQTSSADGEADPALAHKKEFKIGMEEALERMRRYGVEADPEHVPMGGAKFQWAVETGVLKPGRLKPRHRRRLPFPRISLSGLALSMALLISLALLSGIGLYFVIAQPSFEPPPATPTPIPTTPAPTLTIDESFGSKIRGELDQYNRYLAKIKTLVDQQRANKLQWEDFRRNFDDLQKQLKDEKKVVDTLASSVQPRLLNPYKALQDLAVTMNNGADYMVSGIHNYEPDDLDEALRQFSRASNQLADIAKQLNEIVPLPTPTAAPELTPQTDLNGAPTVTTATDSDLTSTVTPATPGINTTAATSSTTTPAPTETLAVTATPAPTGTPEP